MPTKFPWWQVLGVGITILSMSVANAVTINTLKVTQDSLLLRMTANENRVSAIDDKYNTLSNAMVRIETKIDLVLKSVDATPTTSRK